MDDIPQKNGKERMMPTGIYQRTKPAWNKGLTKSMNSSVAKYSNEKIGKPLSDEHKQKLSEAKKGTIPWNKGKKGTYTTSKKGTFASEETKLNMSKAHKGTNLSEEHKRNIGLASKGNKYRLGQHASKETRLKLSESHKGEKSYLWKGGITEQNQLIRCGIEYRLWREAVFARDNWTCQDCGKRGGELNAHHIKSFAEYPELRFAIDNGETLCKDCHDLTKIGRGKVKHTNEAHIWDPRSN